MVVPEAGIPGPPCTEGAGKRLGNPVAETDLDLGHDDGQCRPDLLVPDIEGKRLLQVPPGARQVLRQALPAQRVRDALGV